MSSGWFRVFVTLLGWATLTVAASALVIRQLRVDSQPLLVATSVAGYLSAAVLLAVPAFAVARRWVSLAVAVGVGVFAVAAQAPLFLRDQAAAGGTELRVLQTNLRVGGADPAVIVATVRSGAVDVLTVNELTEPAVAGLAAAGLDDELPHRYLKPGIGGAGTGIWSRYPLSDQRDLDRFGLHSLSARPTCVAGGRSWRPRRTVR